MIAERIPEIQSALRDAKLDGWLFLCFQRNDPISPTSSGWRPAWSRGAATTWCRGAAIRASSATASSPRCSTSCRDEDALQQVVRASAGLAIWSTGSKRLAVQYSHNNELPGVSRLDAGTAEFLRSTGCELVSSAELVQQFAATWTDEQLAGHRRANVAPAPDREGGVRASPATRCAPAARSTSTRCSSSSSTRFRKEKLVWADEPIVGVNATAPTRTTCPAPRTSQPIRKGDFLLIDLWAKEATPTASTATSPGRLLRRRRRPSGSAKIFDIVAARARRGLELVRTATREQPRPRLGGGRRGPRRDRRTPATAQYFFHRTGHSIGTGDARQRAPTWTTWRRTTTRRALPRTASRSSPASTCRRVRRAQRDQRRAHAGARRDHRRRAAARVARAPGVNARRDGESTGEDGEPPRGRWSSRGCWPPRGCCRAGVPPRERPPRVVSLLGQKNDPGRASRPRRGQRRRSAPQRALHVPRPRAAARRLRWREHARALCAQVARGVLRARARPRARSPPRPASGRRPSSPTPARCSTSRAIAASKASAWRRSIASSSRSRRRSAASRRGSRCSSSWRRSSATRRGRARRSTSWRGSRARRSTRSACRRRRAPPSQQRRRLVGAVLHAIVGEPATAELATFAAAVVRAASLATWHEGLWFYRPDLGLAADDVASSRRFSEVVATECATILAALDAIRCRDGPSAARLHPAARYARLAAAALARRAAARPGLAGAADALGADARALSPPGPPGRLSTTMTIWLAIVFFFSGAAALIYQVVWQRALFAVYGLDVTSVTVVVAAFMLGLGLGSLAGGALSRRFPGAAVLLFGAFEFGIGVFGLGSLRAFAAAARLTAGAGHLGTGVVVSPGGGPDHADRRRPADAGRSSGGAVGQRRALGRRPLLRQHRRRRGRRIRGGRATDGSARSTGTVQAAAAVDVALGLSVVAAAWMARGARRDERTG